MTPSQRPYTDLETALAKLDQRPLGYQFDLERDIRWDRIDEPGDYFPPDLLRDLGVDVATLAAHPAAWTMYQWACALMSAEGFMLTEQHVLDFLGQHATLLAHRSNDLFCAEERKHIEMFRRMARALRDQHPAWTFAFDRIFEEEACGPVALDVLAEFTEPELVHGAFWSATTYFEELTVYLHARLRGHPGTQPCWADVHEAHMREEVQHLRTDAAHLSAVPVTDSQRALIARGLRLIIASGFDRAFMTRVAEHMVREAFPAIALAPIASPEETPVFRDIVERHPTFRRTRQNLGIGPEVPSTSPLDEIPRGTRVSPTAAEIERWLVTRLATLLELRPHEIDPAGELQRLALDSLKVTELAAELEEWLGQPLPATLLWDHPTLRAVAAAVSQKLTPSGRR